MQLGVVLFPGPLVLLRPIGQEILRRVVRRTALRYRQDVERAWYFQ